MQTTAERILAKLVSLPTVSKDITANDMALDFIERYLVKRGMHSERFRFDGHGALVASTRADNAKHPAVLLAGHIDVVAGSEKMFTLVREGDLLKGRGVYDMKFAIAGYMQLVDDLQDNLADYDFAIMITTDEEYGNKDGISGTHRLTELGYGADVCILPDSTAPDWEVERVAKGHWRFDLVAEGRAAHGSRPWEGESASFKLIHALHDLRSHFNSHGPLTDSLNIGMIAGGEAFNQVPAHMLAGVEIRLVDDTSLINNQALLQKICDRHDVTVKTRGIKAVLHHNLQHSLLQIYMDSVEAVTGRRPRGFVSLGGSDADYLNRVGVPCILSCPKGGRHHSEDEWISRQSFQHFVPILHNYIDKVAKPMATPVNIVDLNQTLVYNT